MARVLVLAPLSGIVLVSMWTIIVGLLQPPKEERPTPRAEPLLRPLRTGATEKVSGSNCLACHTPLADIPILAPGVVFSHQQHKTPDLHCPICHDTANHVLSRGRGHDLCIECHQDMIEDEGQCHKCHESMLGLRPASHGDDFVPAHASQVDASCYGCHDREKHCDRCHTLPMPHPAGYRDTHGRDVKLMRGDCSRCHTLAWCDQCHGMRMPHPSDWASRHDEGYKAARQMCAKCHPGLVECQPCHQKVKPLTHDEQWAETHGKRLDAYCIVCHSQKYCDDCHGGIPMPHPTVFAVQHAEPTYNNPQSCAICHPQAECAKCHPPFKPKTHVNNWLIAHATRSKGQRPLCLLCHDIKAEKCDICHRNLPPPTNGQP